MVNEDENGQDDKGDKMVARMMMPGRALLKQKWRHLLDLKMGSHCDCDSGTHTQFKGKESDICYISVTVLKIAMKKIKVLPPSLKANDKDRKTATQFKNQCNNTITDGGSTAPLYC